MLMNFKNIIRYRECQHSQHWPASTQNVYSKVQTQNANLKLA